MGGLRVHRYSASSFDCSTPFAASGGSVGMPVGVRVDAVYSPVWGFTTQLARNCIAPVSAAALWGDGTSTVFYFGAVAVKWVGGAFRGERRRTSTTETYRMSYHIHNLYHDFV